MGYEGTDFKFEVIRCVEVMWEQSLDERKKYYLHKDGSQSWQKGYVVEKADKWESSKGPVAKASASESAQWTNPKRFGEAERT